MPSSNTAPLPMIRTGYTKILIDVFAKHGINIQKLLRDSGLPPDLFNTDKDYLPTEPVKRLIYLLSSQVGINNFSELLRLAFRQRIIPQILKQFSEAVTVKEALEKASDVFKSDSPGSSISFEEEYNKHWFCRSTPYENSVYFLWSEVFAILYIIELIQALTKTNWFPQQIRIQHNDADALLSSLNSKTQLFIGQHTTAVLIDDDILHKEIHISHSDTEQKQPLVEWHSSFSDSVFTALLPYVREHSLTVNQAAKLLNMTSRTFQRRLKKERTSFRQIKESLMLSVSCELMEEGHSLTHISNQLGYNNISHFSRAFKRISGLTPKLYKKTILGLQN
ncbi:helix-turn-helix domain-containing protein [Aliivibrio fischeri]|uniref:helix-turn-helix domain-containing protein n=1 Tax=Aliivibrio fischeri TaxID=668 RepID=UPI0012D9D060|nr:helix-turn-helix transcriptional regulator [Aliivibrio fischeri]MUL01269.1 helix-turn-helix domain-containing protein [Aliivibrio fischeri]